MIGCRGVACAPGFTIRDPAIDLRMTLQGDVLESAGIQFQRITRDTFHKLKLSRRISNKSDKTFTFQIAKGVSTISGIVPMRGQAPPALLAHVQLKRAVLEKLYKQAFLDNRRTREAIGELTIEQIREGISIYKSLVKIQVKIFPCRQLDKKVFEDRIELKNKANGADVLVSYPGRDQPLPSSSCADYNAKNERSSLSTVEVGNMLNGEGCPSEVATFSQDYRVEVVRPSSWTNLPGDIVPVNLNGLLPIPIAAWVLYDPFGKADGEIKNGIERANKLYSNAMCGVRFADPNIKHDHRSSDFATASHAVNTAKGWGLYDGTMVNLYIVERVGDDKAQTTGASNGVLNDRSGNEIVVDLDLIQPNVISHELGHVLALEHTPTAFPSDNLMENREHGDGLTKGQCYRTNVDAGSYVNTDNVRTNGAAAAPVKLYSCPWNNAEPSLCAANGSCDWCPRLDFNP